MQRNNFLVGVILLIWFVISFVTNILGPLMPIIIQTYKLSLTMAAFLPFSFFLAYGIMSIPSGMMIERIGEKKSMLIAFTLNFIGAIAFGLYPQYSIALGSLFIIGMGMAMLQVIINPLMRTAGGEENFAFFSVMGQLVFGLASFISPFVFSYLLSELSATPIGNPLVGMLAGLVKDNLSWTALYWLFSFIFLLILLLLSFIKMPVVELKDDEKSGATSVYLGLLKNKEVLLFFVGIVAYVGTEQALANWMSEFLRTYHNVDPNQGGAQAVAWFWGLMSLGCLLGLALLKLWDSKLILKIATLISMVTVSIALFGEKDMALYAFPLAGFFISVMFSIIFSLALNSVAQHHGSFSGILCSGIFGGALVPLIIGSLGDVIGLRYALMFLYITLAYILFLAYYAKPMINNKTVSLKELLVGK
ncbi:MAG: MFS transporter [Candidatus Pedobacter colombiensis]|uniref:MFS transporter n=1 Tax=Candidatus Pedobacter colombiensis TaxID=3121371 RepID=A0AAJ5W714_9SPHI|nr:MFS transporter [Pedobacter sp.]WEK17727.1 MAG: MFS transporter [Pedobacter sp.]